MTLVLLLSGCECISGCPREEDRFDFDVPLDQTFDDPSMTELEARDVMCPGGLTVDEWYETPDGEVRQVYCDGTWCREEYAGHQWCLPTSVYEAWEDASCPGCWVLSKPGVDDWPRIVEVGCGC